MMIAIWAAYVVGFVRTLLAAVPEADRGALLAAIIQELQNEP